MNGGSTRQETHSVSRGEAIRDGAQRMAAITLVVLTTTVIFSLPHCPLGMSYAFIHCTKLIQCNYVII